MVVCKFFLQGNCRYGADCRNEHPGAGGGRGGGSFSNQNRFGALSGNNRSGGGGGGNARKDIWQFNPDDIPNDLAAGKGRPMWILSSYGPGKNPPASLLQDNELSSEEVRARFYELAAQGKQDEADREAMTLWSKAEQDISQIVRNARDVEKFIQEAERRHPNRDDFAQMDGTKTRDQFVKEVGEPSSSNVSGGLGTSSGGGFGSNSSSSPFGPRPNTAFGQPSQPSAFGASSTFGKPSLTQGGFGGSSPSGGTFGQASSSGGFGSHASAGGFGRPAFGQSGFGAAGSGQPGQPTSAFGQPSQPTSTFGQPAKPVSAFGQPPQTSSAFGQPAFGSSGFGSNAAKNAFAPASASSGFGGQSTSSFGQPSQPGPAFGQTSQPTSAFGQPSQPTSAFGQPSKPGSAFGNPAQTSTPFGQPPTSQPGFGQTPQTSQPTGFGSNTSPFGQPTTTSSGFGSSSAPAFGQTGFGSSTAPAFGQTTAPTNPFGAPAATEPTKDENMDSATPVSSRPQSRANPFGAPNLNNAVSPQETKPTAINTSTTPNPLTGRPPAALHYTESLPANPTQKNGQGRLVIYRGQAVTYIGNIPCFRRPDTRELEKIWFPDGGAGVDIQGLNREDKVADCEGKPEEYSEEVLGEYRYLFEEGRWKEGKVPLVPPLRDWAVYDF